MNTTLTELKSWLDKACWNENGRTQVVVCFKGSDGEYDAEISSIKASHGYEGNRTIEITVRKKYENTKV